MLFKHLLYVISVYLWNFVGLNREKWVKSKSKQLMKAKLLSLVDRICWTKLLLATLKVIGLRLE